MKLKALAIALLGLLGSCQAQPAYATEETQVIGPFGGLDTTDNAAIVPANQAQDLLNVDIAPGGRSIKKRKGLSLDTTFSVSTGPVHGAYKFFDASGNEVRLWGQDTGLWASVSGSTLVRVATGTVAATWQCTDYLGFAYCVTSARDTPVKTNGTTTGSTYQGAIPAGTIIASTGERLLVSGVSGQAQRLYYSGASNFTDFTLGALTSSSSFEDITSPGSAITHVAYYHNKWEIWKDQSFVTVIGTDQTNLNIITVSNTIGTFDNTDAYDSGLCYFRGNDNQFYTYDGNSLRRISRDITPTVNSSNRRKSASWTGTTQADFSNGTAVIPAVNLSTTIISGALTVSSFSVTESTGSAWTAGSNSNFAVGFSSLSLKMADGNIANNGFENGSISNWTSDFSAAGNTTGVNCTLAPRNGTKALNVATASCNLANYNVYAQALTCDGTFISSTTIAQANNSCTYTLQTLTFGSSFIGKPVKIKFLVDPACTAGTAVSDCFVFSGTNPTFYSASDDTRASVPVLQSMYLDDVTSGSDTINTGWFLSQIFNTGVTSSTVQAQADWTVNSSTPLFSVLTATSNPSNNWTTLLTSTGTNAIGNKFLRYTSTITIPSGSFSGLTSISTVTVISKSTGTFYSAVFNAPNLTSWGSANMTDTILSGGGTINYFVRSSTSPFYVTNSSPPWVSQANGGTVASSTGTYMQLIASFTVVAATDTPTLNDWTLNWYEGVAADKMYATYFDYAVLFAVSLGTTTSANNRILRYDLLNSQAPWTVYDIPANGFLTYSTNLYIGDSTAGKAYRFGGVDSDNGVAINAYWKSKDFFGSSPFSDDDMRSMSWYCKSSSGTTLSVAYTVNESSTTSYSINLYDPLSNIIRHNRKMTLGTLANVLNVQIGDTSANPGWECFAGQFTFEPRPWNVYP